MKSRAELIEFFGLSAVAEVQAEEGNVTSPAYDPAEGYNFYGIALSSVKGNPIEHASKVCNADCFANTDADTLYIATKGTVSGGTQVK